ncbi:hypothetical protein LTR84_002922 [Exophiala bonariae]|uniref:DUF1770-domain-containing protein n=1 Tax=Exophiala bonariae TaxID=1690606 RepID=A0AAV9NCR0_9EURO|nr:hypothetical protein LTR84_002922 [Exophiala bonariae]
MEHNPAAEFASVIQSASIKRHPSPAHDINPSTAASKKVPGTAEYPSTESPTHSRSHSLASASTASSSTSTIPSEIIRQRPRRRDLPPMPDFRFEQSYLASIKNAESNWKVAFITIRDQVVLPLTQGILWNLAMFGWRHWNRGTKFRGRGVGARVRKWWWGVNNWKMPSEVDQGGRDAKVLKKAEGFFVNRFGTSLGD